MTCCTVKDTRFTVVGDGLTVDGGDTRSTIQLSTAEIETRILGSFETVNLTESVDNPHFLGPKFNLGC